MKIRHVLMGMAAMLALMALIAAMRSWREPVREPSISVAPGTPPVAAVPRANPSMSPGGGAVSATASLGDAASLLAGSTDAVRMHDAIASEPRDGQWAPPTEALVRAALRASSGGEDLNVMCRRTLCEATGPLRNGRTALIAQETREALGKIGLVPDASVVGSDTAGRRRFIAYFKRRD